MKFASLHPWFSRPGDAIRLQKTLAPRVSLQPPEKGEFRLVAGADVSSTLRGSRLWAAVLVLRLPSFEVVEEADAERPAELPYIPGLLSFREIPVLLEAFKQLRLVPDAVLCDGQGLAHPRFFGLACHLGLWLNLPTIGCAKSRLVGDHTDPGPQAGDWSLLRYQDKTVGAALRTRAHCRPIFVSPGHLMNLELALHLVSQCCLRSRLPEPTRLADLAVNRFRRDREKL